MKYIIRFSTLYIFYQIESDLSKWIRMDQIGSKWIKTDQTWSDWISDEIIIEIHHQIFNLQIFFDQIESDLSKMDQTWSDLISLIKLSTFSMFSISDEIIIELYHQIFNFIYFLSDLIRSVQNGSKWIKLDQIRFLMK